MDLNEQMDTGLDAVLVEAGANVDEQTRRLLRLAWLDGYKGGMVAVHSIAENAFEKVTENLP